MFINCLFVLRAPFIFPVLYHRRRRLRRDRNPEEPSGAGAFLLRQMKHGVCLDVEFTLDKARLDRKISLRSTLMDRGKMKFSAS